MLLRVWHPGGTPTTAPTTDGGKQCDCPWGSRCAESGASPTLGRSHRPPTTAVPTLTREKTTRSRPSANFYSGLNCSTALYALPTRSDEEPKCPPEVFRKTANLNLIFKSLKSLSQNFLALLQAIEGVLHPPQKLLSAHMPFFDFMHP